MAELTNYDDIVVRAVSDLIELTVGGIRNQAKVTPPERLFHFTDADGSIGILTGQVFWASLSTALNDASEERYTLDLAMDLVRRKKVGGGQFSKALLKYLDDPTLIPAFAIKARAFIVSFCSDADSAPQWLHYGRQGNGLALCFDGKQLSATKHCDLVPIVYDTVQQTAYLSSLIRTARSRIARDIKNVPQPFAKVLIDAGAHLVAQSIRIIVAAQLKAPAFRPENEWRLVTLEFDSNQLPESLRSKVNTIFYRSRNHRVVPYLKIPVPVPSPLVNIVLGHSNPMEDNEPALRLLWERTINGTPQILRSGVTVRP